MTGLGAQHLASKLQAAHSLQPFVSWHRSFDKLHRVGGAAPVDAIQPNC